ANNVGAPRRELHANAAMPRNRAAAIACCHMVFACMVNSFSSRLRIHCEGPVNIMHDRREGSRLAPRARREIRVSIAEAFVAGQYPTAETFLIEPATSAFARPDAELGA